MDRIILTTIHTLFYFLVYYCLFPTPGSHPQGFTYRLVTSSQTSFVTNLTILEESRARTLPWDLSFIYLSQLDGLRGRGSQRESINPLGQWQHLLACSVTVDTGGPVSLPAILPARHLPSKRVHACSIHVIFRRAFYSSPPPPAPAFFLPSFTS